MYGIIHFFIFQIFTDDWASLTGPSVIPTSLLPPFSVSATSPNNHSAIFRFD